MAAKSTKPAEKLGYEEAREKLAEIVAQLESGQVPLSGAMELWEQGEKLAAICSEWLEGAKTRIEETRDQAGD